MYGATNQAFMSDAFDESSELEEAKEVDTTKAVADLVAAIESAPPADDLVEGDKEGDERESWDSKIMFLLATIG